MVDQECRNESLGGDRYWKKVRDKGVLTREKRILKKDKRNERVWTIRKTEHWQ